MSKKFLTNGQAAFKNKFQFLALARNDSVNSIIEIAAECLRSAYYINSLYIGNHTDLCHLYQRISNASYSRLEG